MFNIKEFLGLGYYTSELDEFLENFDKKHPILTASQQAEAEKYARIYRLRDKPTPDEATSSDFWDKF